MTTDSRVALVSGTSSGMGLHTAVGLASAGWTVVATMRDLARVHRLRDAASAAGVQVDTQTLDVTVPSSVNDVVARTLDSYGRLDVLVNNAGRGAVATLEQLDDADLQAQLDVNYLGVARLTRAVLPVMRAAGRGRIVTVTSVGGVIGQPFADAYCASKFAVEGLMQSLAPVVARFGVEVSVVEPGAVGSDFVANVAGVATSALATGAYGDLLAAYLERTAGAFDQAQTPEDAAAVIVHAATTPDWQYRWQTTPQAATFAGLSLGDLDGSRVLGYTSTWLG